MNRKTWLIAGALLLGIPVVALVWWLASPLFLEDEVNEALPEDILFVTPTPAEFSFSAPATLDMPTAEAGATMMAAATQVTQVADPMPTELAAMPQEQVTALEVARGQFRDAGDGFHMGSGDAILFQLSTGEHLLRFENFRVTNGPDLHVYLVPRRNDVGVDISGYVDLGELRGSVGDQNYIIPAGVSLPPEASIVIWCEPFAVLFSVASLN